MGDASVVSQVEILAIRLPDHVVRGRNGTMLAILDCRIGPFRIKGAALFDRDNGSFRVRMPQCRLRSCDVMLTDKSWQRELKAKAMVAYRDLAGLPTRD